jgi:5-methylcytosine-specific restriction endonuclease McrA
MLRSPTVCGEPGCGQPNVRGTRWCEKHQQNNSFIQTRRDNDRTRWKNDSVRRLYGAARWEHFRTMMLAHNPICQRLQRDGQQCHNPALLVHHLVSPRVDVSKFLDIQNVVCLCEHCHPTGEGTPQWRAGVDYVSTRYKLPTFG